MHMTQMLCYALQKSSCITLMSNNETAGYYQRLGFRSSNFNELDSDVISRIQNTENLNKDKLQPMLITQEIHYDKLNLGRLFMKYYSLNNPEVPIYTCEEPKRVIINDLVRDS